MSSGVFSLQETEDGSFTVYRKDIDETYHSHKGAMGESQYVFIEQGLDHQRELGKDPIRIFEVGFGTGLNAWLAWEFAEKHKVNINYFGIESIPLEDEIWSKLDYTQNEDFDRLHTSEWDAPHELSTRYTFTKVKTRLEEFNSNLMADVVFYDAFAPSKQPDVWELENLKKCFGILESGGILVTYCAQGQFKRNLKACGFEVETLPGALGKKEMVRAHKNQVFTNSANTSF